VVSLPRSAAASSFSTLANSHRSEHLASVREGRAWTHPWRPYVDSQHTEAARTTTGATTTAEATAATADRPPFGGRKSNTQARPRIWTSQPEGRARLFPERDCSAPDRHWQPCGVVGHIFRQAPTETDSEALRGPARSGSIEDVFNVKALCAPGFLNHVKVRKSPA
jgi:hypothetical protein